MIYIPKVFISYSWEDDGHKERVRALADSLLKNGIDATLDQYDLSLGDRLPQFMEQAVADSDYVLIICTPTYKEKSDNRKGGVGYEGHIISGEILTTGNERKFIPVIFKGTAESSIPIFLSGKFAANLSNNQTYAENFDKLLSTLQGKIKKPPVNYAVPIKPTVSMVTSHEPIHILGINTSQVTAPRMDGTWGSALYKVPLTLSSHPSRLWIDLFLRAWDSPPSFTTMHRPGIASVYGNQILLDGTTIEEVRDYHKKTLLLCVEQANKEEEQILKERQRQIERETAMKNKHYLNVQNIADEIKF